jgi:hypothetical protein
MTKDDAAGAGAHLTEADFFTLALPPAGEPEALPRHLSDCADCSRHFSEWRSAVRELGNEGMETLRGRTAADWEALEDRTIERIRRARQPKRTSLRWAVAIAASLLLFALALPLWRSRERAERISSAATQVLSPQDQADDALLRDVARLARSEDDNSRLWREIAPEPSAAEEDRL